MTSLKFSLNLRAFCLCVYQAQLASVNGKGLFPFHNFSLVRARGQFGLRLGSQPVEFTITIAVRFANIPFGRASTERL
jgi:hypothetical protein